MSQRLEWDWRIGARGEERRWVAALQWRQRSRTYRRGEAARVELSEEAELRLRRLEDFVRGAEKRAAAQVIEKYGSDYLSAWDHAWANGLMRETRELLTTNGYDPNSWEYVAAELAHRKAIATCRAQRAGYLPIGVRDDHVPTVRMRVGRFYSAPLTDLDEVGAWDIAGLGRIVLEGFSGDLSGCSYGDAARIGRSWWMRFVFTQSSEAIERDETPDVVAR